MRHFVYGLILMLSACMSANTERYGSVDRVDKSIALPAGGGTTLSLLKRELPRKGWKVVVAGNAIVTTRNGNQAKTQSSSGARYTLFFKKTLFSTCFNGEDSDIVTASLIDNHTNAEVFTYDGKACADQIAQDLLNLITEDGAKDRVTP